MIVVMKWAIALVVVVSVGLAYLDWAKMQPKETGSSASPTPQAMTYTLAQVAEHADKASCWLVLEEKVYDVTQFVASGFHSGKEAILQGCGKDATELFNTRPMAEKPSSHSSRARSMLPKYLIGTLEE